MLWIWIWIWIWIWPDSGRPTRPDSDRTILAHISTNIGSILLKLVPLDRSHPPGAVHVQISCLELHPEQPGVKPDSLILAI